MTRKVDHRALARQVLRIRIGQLLVNEGLKRQAFAVPLHLALGHEAIAAAVDHVMRPGDQLLLTHRNIHYNLARCASFGAEYGEYLLREDALAGGRLGSMNLSNPDGGIPYASSILGNNLPVAAGMALASDVIGDGAVTFVVTGDGAMEEGAFYESLLFMKSNRLAALIVVENNGWSLATDVDERRCPIALEALASSLAIPYGRLEGGDAIECAGRLDVLRPLAALDRTPVVVEVPLTTLGFWHAPDDRYPSVGRFVNYHHGAAPNAAVSDWPVLVEDDSDPVHLLRSYVPDAWLADTARDLHRSLSEALP